MDKQNPQNMDQSDHYSKYIDRVSSMTPAEKHDHLRIDYRVPTQEWPDYLDYVEEWRDQYQRKLSQIRRDFIYHALAKHCQRMECGNHTHQFTTDVSTHPDMISIPNRDAYLDEHACWYNNISMSEDELINQSHSLNSASLSSSQTQQFKRIVGLRMVTGDEFSTPTLLNCQKFGDIGFTQPTKNQAYDILMKSGIKPIPPTIPISTTSAGYQTPPSTDVKTWFVSGKTDIIMENEDILDDHGFHALMRVRVDRTTVLKKINKIRRPYSPNITPSMVHEAVKRCNKCKHSSPLATTTYPGIFYSPPGNGKSTTMKNEIFIGIDTDWLLKHSTYQEMCQPFVKLGIPILTNQYSIIIDTDRKMFGSFSVDHLRTRNGIPYTPIEEIHKAMLISQGDLVILYNNGYLSRHLISVLLMQFIHDVIVQHAYSINRVRLKHVKSHHHPISDLQF